MLYASAQFNSFSYAIDPTTLTATVLPNSSLAPGPDGIDADGMGNLYIASRSTSDIYKYDRLRVKRLKPGRVKYSPSG
jgi:hypothetical protein